MSQHDCLPERATVAAAEDEVEQKEVELQVANAVLAAAEVELQVCLGE